MNTGMLAEATIGDLSERDFLREIDEQLRAGNVDLALARISVPMAKHCRPGGPLPADLIDLTADDIVVEGWDDLEARMRETDREGYPVTALGIEIANEPADGHYPAIETCFYTDSAYPFSECDRDALLEGYSSYGTEWQGSSDDCDATIAISGLHEAWAAVVALGASLRASEDDLDERALQAFTLGSCYLAALVHAAIKKAVDERGLSRPLAIFVAANDSYPGFDAPVATHFDVVNAPATEAKASLPPTIANDDDRDTAEATRPFDQGPPSEPADPFTPSESADPEVDPFLLHLSPADETHPDAYYELPDTASHVSGTQLRKRFITEESIALTQEAEPESLIQRLFGRFKPRS